MSLLTELKSIAERVVGESVPRPSGKLSGHAGGLPFETVVHTLLVNKFGDRAWRHYEALNEALRHGLGDGSNAKDFQFGPPDVHFLVKRGQGALANWSEDKPFEEKQNDTAESIVWSDSNDRFDSDLVSLIDVKTQNTEKASQPPNIISGVKIADLAEIVLDDGLAPHFEILYVGVKFEEAQDAGGPRLVCTDATAIDLMRIPPANIYINWAAATQIQFHPFEVAQSFTGSSEEWLASYLSVFCDQLERRMNKQQDHVTRLRALLDSRAQQRS